MKSVLNMLVVLSLALCGNLAIAEEPPVRYATRGEMLYALYCTNCHRDYSQWMDQKAVKDWKSLKSEVRHWQLKLELQWNKDDIEDVARYLNVTYYNYPWSD
jgi:hypothetical protein